MESVMWCVVCVVWNEMKWMYVCKKIYYWLWHSVNYKSYMSPSLHPLIHSQFFSFSRQACLIPFSDLTSALYLWYGDWLWLVFIFVFVNCCTLCYVPKALSANRATQKFILCKLRFPLSGHFVEKYWVNLWISSG